jgi:hypothetical protein
MCFTETDLNAKNVRISSESCTYTPFTWYMCSSQAPQMCFTETDLNAKNVRISSKNGTYTPIFLHFLSLHTFWANVPIFSSLHNCDGILFFSFFKQLMTSSGS